MLVIVIGIIVPLLQPSFYMWEMEGWWNSDPAQNLSVLSSYGDDG